MLASRPQPHTHSRLSTGPQLPNSPVFREVSNFLTTSKMPRGSPEDHIKDLIESTPDSKLTGTFGATGANVFSDTGYRLEVQNYTSDAQTVMQLEPGNGGLLSHPHIVNYQHDYLRCLCCRS